jgi:hypothetical protein
LNLANSQNQTQPDGLGYSNEWPFGPEDAVHFVHVDEFRRIHTGNEKRSPTQCS